MLFPSCGSNRQVDVVGGDDVVRGRVEEPVTSQPELEVHRGTLAKTVEAGGWLLKTGGEEYLLLATSSYRQEPWFQEGAGVEVKGRKAAGVTTIYMQGVPFRVSAMRLLESAGQRHR